MIRCSVGKYPLFFKKKTIDKLVKTVCQEVSKHFAGESSIFDISFVSKNKIKQINKRYRNKNVPTDVVSFAFRDSKAPRTNLLGEIFISTRVAKKNAKKIGNSLPRELCFLVVHGALHLLGHDHQNKTEEKAMIAIQKEIMSKLIY